MNVLHGICTNTLKYTLQKKISAKLFQKMVSAYLGIEKKIVLFRIKRKKKQKKNTFPYFSFFSVLVSYKDKKNKKNIFLHICTLQQVYKVYRT
jgi:uncharacterized protein (DUF2461 family)